MLERQKALLDAERAFLNPKEQTVLDEWLLTDRSITEVAAEVGMTKGGVSKMAARLEKRLRAKNISK